jgi:hypothetical protein
MNVQGLRRRDKWPELAREFKQRNYFIAGISETWTADNGIWYDEDEKIWLIYEGLHETETNKGKVHCGIGFMLNQRAFQLLEKKWKKNKHAKCTCRNNTFGHTGHRR